MRKKKNLGQKEKNKKAASAKIFGKGSAIGSFKDENGQAVLRSINT